LAALLFGAGTASAAALPAAETRVGAITPTVTTVVGVAEHIAAGQHRVRAPSQSQIVSGNCVAAEAARAAETAAGAGDHIVLGLRANGLEEAAAKVGGRTLLNDPDWMAAVHRGVGNPSTKVTVSLDGMSGSSTYSQVMSAAQRGAGGAGGYTDWEMAQLFEGGRLADTTFVRGGQVVNNPFGP